jgi:dipeptidyl aminopeptidase/acylaminoacyl peptidase
MSVMKSFQSKNPELFYGRCLGILFSIPLLLNIAMAQEAPDGWTPELSMEFRRLQATAMSSDGSHVAYILSTPLMEGKKSEFQSQIWVAATDGSSNRQYTQGNYSATAPAFSPDGEYLSFSAKREEGEDSKTQIWVMPLFGGEARQLTDAAENVSAYKWSPDGSRLAFTMQEPLSAERKKQVEEKRDVILVDLQPRYRHLHVVPAELDSGELQQPLQLSSGELVVGSFDWSPAGDEIVFSHSTTADLDVSDLEGDISIVTVPGVEDLVDMVEESTDVEEDAAQEETLRIVGNTRVLASGRGSEGNPYWSPDGNWIAYTSSGSEPNLIGLGDVYVMPAAGGDSRQLAQTPNRSPNIAGWSNTSDELYLVETLATRRAVIGLPLRGDEIRTLTPPTGVVGNVALAGDAASLVYSWQTADQPWNLFAQTTASDSASVQLTDLHSQIPIPEMGRTELVSWDSEDGTRIEGFLTYPIGYVEGRSYPVILNVHGGPSGVFVDGFTGGPGIYQIQYFAQNGFAILRPNPRGSTGYGYEFREATATNWGEGDFKDLLTGLDMVIDMGVGNVDQQYLMGWSYGGYMTSWAVTQTDRFKAASMGAGLSNLVSMSMTSDIRRYLVEHMGDYYWNDMEAYQKSSAMHHIENVVTPTQVIHGQEDERVPTSQGQEFYHALKYRGIDTEMIVYPRTPHGPREPKFLMDVSPRILAWFNKYRGD